MFTGLVEDCQPLLMFNKTADGAQLTIAKGFEATKGDSIAVDGCCLTVAQNNQSSLTFELSAETLATTHFASLANIHGYRLNVERSLVVGGRLHGHLVSGHIDGVATVVDRTDNGLFKLSLPLRCDRLLAVKGSLAVNGVSLTINKITTNNSCLVVQTALISETLTKTNLGTLTAGQEVNFELDMIAKYLDKLCRA